jgi:hypothetical protein
MNEFHGEVLALLEQTGDVNADELALVLARYPHLDEATVRLETLRFTQTWTGGTMRSLSPYGNWLDKARVAARPAIRASGALDPSEIERRVSYHRRLIADGESLGETYLGPAEVEELCADYREKLETRR